MRKAVFCTNELQICDLSAQYEHALYLMELANHGVESAEFVAVLALERYFERIEEEWMPQPGPSGLPA